MDQRSFWHFLHSPHGARGAHTAGRRGGGGFPWGGGNPFGGNPFGGGNPFRGGPHGHRGGRARRGDVRTAILVLLLEEPRNGYQLMVEIEKRSEGAWRPSPGSTYPALQQLEDEGLVRVEGTSGGRTFHLTDRGRAEAEALGRDRAPWEAAAGEDPNSIRELATLIRQVSVAAVQVAQAGTPAQIAEARRVLIEARKALYRLLADAEVDEEG